MKFYENHNFNSISLIIKIPIMKKNYLNLVLVFIFGLCCHLKGFAQLPIVANDDVANNINSSQGGYFWNIFIGNDTLNGNSINGGVIITHISSTNEGIYVSGNALYVNPGTPVGTYTVVYQICQNNFPNNCDTATITVNICNQPAPTFSPPDCYSYTDTIILNDLPADGPWTLTMYYNGVVVPDAIGGTGTSHTLNNLQPGGYAFIVTNSTGCTSPLVYHNLGYLDGMDTTIAGTYSDLNNDGIVNVGDIIDYQITIINPTDCELTNAEVEFEQWNNTATIFGSPIATIAAGASAEVTAFYHITQQDINNGGFINNWFAITGVMNGFEMYTKAFDETGVALNIPDGFKFNAFIDENANSIQDNNEEDFSLGYFQYTINDSETVHSLYGNDPIIYESGPFMTYDVTFVVYPEYANYYNLVTASYMDVSIVGNPGVTTYNFPLTTFPYQDVSIAMYNATTATPGFPYVNYITFKNNGNQTIPSGSISLLSTIDFPITSPEAITLTPEGFTFNFTNLLPFEARTMMFTMQMPTIPTVSLGDIVGNVASISSVEGDLVPENNFSVVNTTIVGSYDPNDKAENHNGEIIHDFFTQNDYLNYTIRFENTGTANAFTVKVTDVLDNKLDEDSMRMIGASHDYLLERIGSELVWTFNNIQLPPSVPNTQTGHGYIAFKVKPKTGYAVGDIIENTASIYFDFNPAIITNTTYSEFVAFLNTDDFTGDELKVYPNPVKNLLNIVSNNSTVETVTVHDILGKTMLSKTGNGISTILDFSGLSTGMYIVKVVSAQGEKVFKILKE